MRWADFLRICHHRVPLNDAEHRAMNYDIVRGRVLRKPAYDLKFGVPSRAHTGVHFVVDKWLYHFRHVGDSTRGGGSLGERTMVSSGGCAHPANVILTWVKACICLIIAGQSGLQC